jgi:hypothetical protein
VLASGRSSFSLEAMNSSSPRQWHTTALAVILSIWAAWLFTVLLSAMAHSSRGMLSPRLLCVFALIPLLMSAGAYLLFTGNKLRLIPFLLLPLVEFWLAIEFFPSRLNPLDWEMGPSYFAQFPLGTRLFAGFFAACAVYCLFLNRRESVHMASNQRLERP